MTGMRVDNDPDRAALVTHNQGTLTPAPEPAQLVGVLGMHRSGTSGVAELLGRNGIDLGATSALMPATAFNPHGHFEIQALSEFNESVLERLSSTWWAPPSIETVQRAMEDHIADARGFWRSISDGFAGTTPPLIKDPRLSLLLPIWRLVLPPSTLFVICIRDPLAVARSLLARDMIDLPVGLAMWEMYNIAALQGVMDSRVLFVDVDRLNRSADAREDLVAQVRAATGMPPAPEIHDTFDGTLLSSASPQRELNEFLTGTQLSLYRSLRGLPHDVVQVGDLRHLQVSGAALRTIARNRKFAFDSDERLMAHREAEERAGRLDEQVRTLASQLAEAHAQVAAFGTVETLREELGRELDKLSDALDLDAMPSSGDSQELVPRLEAATGAALELSEELHATADRAAALERAQAVGEQRLHDVIAEVEDELTSRITAERKLVAAEERLQELEVELSGTREAKAAMEREQSRAAERVEESASQIAMLHAELARTHALYGAAFASRSWRWTRVFRRESASKAVAVEVDAVSALSQALPATTPSVATGPAADPNSMVQPRHEFTQGLLQGLTPKGAGGYPSSTSPARSSRVAVVVHVFYPDLWDDLASQLTNLQEPFDLYVSLVDGHSEEIAERVRESYPNAVIAVRPNRGRDIAPFLGFVASGDLSGYRAVLKMHTKRSHHRVDGDEWRKALWHGLLPSPEGVRTLIERLANDPDVGSVIPRGNVMGEESLGSNRERMKDLLARIGLDFRDSDVEFAAGSMYWLDGEIIELLKALHVDPVHDFEPEEGQIDGTTAHAMERILGVLVKRRGQRILHAEDLIGEPTTPEWVQRRRPRVLAFYLPQFHRIAENDAWWGEGFTEWVNVAAAEAWHGGQSFPRVPAGPFGEYDLTEPSVLSQQVQLAQQFGVDGFLVYHYWFSGKRLLEAPMDAVLSDRSLKFPYALVWANENWTRAWDGLDRDVLMGQNYEPGWEEALVDSLVPHLKDSRYILLDGRPLVVIFKPSLLPDLSDAAASIRKIALARGVGPVHLAGILHDRHVDGPGPQFAALDSWIEFPPLSGPTPIDVTEQLTDPAGARGRIYSYPRLVDEGTVIGLRQGRRVHPGIMPSWDNTPRRRTGASSFVGANPADFRRWMIEIRRGLAGMSAPGEMLVCINAWNEWAETAYLEPDHLSGLANLEAVHSAFGDVVK